jgi:hypothetical protein
MKSVRFVLEPEILGESKPQTGMWAATKRDTDPTAQQSLEAILQRTNSPTSDGSEHTFERSKMALRKNLEDLRLKPSLSNLKNWMWGFSKYLFPPQKMSNANLIHSFSRPRCTYRARVGGSRQESICDTGCSQEHGKFFLQATTQWLESDILTG